MYTEVIFDVETQKFFDEFKDYDPTKLGVSLVSAYTRVLEDKVVEGRKVLSEIEGSMQSFWEKDLNGLWPLFQKADRIIGFNSLHFDIPVLEPYANFPVAKLPHFDIMAALKDAYGRRVSLNAIAKETLGREKTDAGAMAVTYWQKNDAVSLAKLQSYCEADVLITRDIYDFGLKEGYLLFKDKWNTLRRVEIDFSYPKKEEDNQIGLF